MLYRNQVEIGFGDSSPSSQKSTTIRNARKTSLVFGLFRIQPTAMTECGTVNWANSVCACPWIYTVGNDREAIIKNLLRCERIFDPFKSLPLSKLLSSVWVVRRCWLEMPLAHGADGTNTSAARFAVRTECDQLPCNYALFSIPA